MIRRPIGREMARTAVIAGTATAVSGGVRRRQEERYAEAEYAPAEQPAPEPEAAPAPAATAGPSPEAIEALKELASLKDQGILTDEEFAAQKAKILG
jgi:hypothetical protein